MEQESITIDWLQEHGFDMLPNTEASVYCIWSINTIELNCRKIAEFEYYLYHIQETFHVCPDVDNPRFRLWAEVEVGYLNGEAIQIRVGIPSHGTDGAEKVLNDTCSLVERKRWIEPNPGRFEEYYELVCKENGNEHLGLPEV